MWNYEKRLQYPVKITQTNPKMAQVIISQFGGPDGELAASMRYLSQRYTMPYKEVTGTLTDIGTEELAHMEMICAIVCQLTKNLTPEELERSGFDKYYVDHTLALWPQSRRRRPLDGHGLPVQGGSHHGSPRGYGGGAEGPDHLRQHPPAREGPGGGGSDPVPAGAGDRPLPAVRREPAAGAGAPGLQELLRLQPGIRYVQIEKAGPSGEERFLERSSPAFC